MRITDYLKKKNIFLDSQLEDKPAVLKYIAEVCTQNGIVKDFSALYDGLVQREQTMSTGVGGGIGFPHTASPEAEEAAVILIRLKKPIAFDALDHQPVFVILALIIPEANPEMHVRLLARVSRLCKHCEFLEAIKSASSPERLWEQIRALEENPACQ